MPHAGTAEDGRRFFLSDEELFVPGRAAYVGLFLWSADDVLDEVLVDSRLAGLGDHVLEPIEVEPFTRQVDGVSFGWEVDEHEGTYTITIAPGDVIAYDA